MKRQSDQIIARSIGGDDYIQKPYSLGVLLAKVKAVLNLRENKKNSNKTLELMTMRGMTGKR